MVAAAAHRHQVAMVDQAAELADSLVKRLALGRLVRATMADRLELMHPHIAVLVVVVLLRSARTAMQAVAQAVPVTPTTVRHTLAVVAVAQRRLEVLHLADQALVVTVAVLLRQLAATEHRARDLVVVVLVALALDQPRLLAVMAAMVLL